MLPGKPTNINNDPSTPGPDTFTQGRNLVDRTGAPVSAPQPSAPDAPEWGNALAAIGEAAAAHPTPLSRWRGIVESVSGSTAMVVLSGDEDAIAVPLEVSGVTATDILIVDFREGGGVAGTAIVQ